MSEEYGYYALVDETGGEGAPGMTGAFEFLGITAVLVRCSNFQFTHGIWDRASRIANKNAKWDWPSFKDLKSVKERFLISRLIAELPIRFSTVLAHKPSMHRFDGTEEYGDLYFFLSQLILERISWMARDAEKQCPSGNGRVRIIFSERKSLKYDQFQHYAAAVRSGRSKYPSNCAWDHIDLDAVCARFHRDCEALRLPDFVAGAFGRAAEYKLHSETDDRFVRLLSPICYRPKPLGPLKTKAWRNGLKIYPPEAESTLPREERFRWIQTHYGG